jgi:hypothetical protein
LRIPEHHRRGVAVLCLLVGLVTGVGAMLDSPSVPAGVFFFQAMLLLGSAAWLNTPPLPQRCTRVAGGLCCS